MLSAVEVGSRSIGVFPPLFVTWTVVFLLSIVFAILDSTITFAPGFHFPILIMLIYIVFIAILSLSIGSRNIIMYTTRGLERGYEIAIQQLASKQSSSNIDKASK